jgi:thiol-disulfide isomerase/thioredoxin
MPYVINRAPLQPAAFLALPIGSVQASGWLLEQMQLQVSGLSGHAEDIYQENGPTSGWLGGNGDYGERGPYYVRAVTALAYVLGDATLQARAQKWIDWAVASQTPDGDFGPAALDPRDWWPRMLMLRAVEDVHEATGDPKLLAFLSSYFAYQLANPIDGLNIDLWAPPRMQDDAMVALYTYDRLPSFSTSDFLSLVDALRGDGTDWIGQFNAQAFVPTTLSPMPSHNVNVAMGLKAPAVYWQRSGVDSDRAAYASGVQFILRDDGQPEGMPSGDEILHGSGSTEGVELCGVVDSIASHLYTMLTFGQPATADLIENIAYNALPAATSKTMTGVDYYAIPNEPEAIKGASGFPEDYDNAMTMSWQSGFPCCRFNWHMGWPRLTQSTWAATPDGGLAALVYAPTVVTATVAGGQSVSVVEDTSYPFEEQVRLTLHTASPVSFPLTVRIPGWATSASVTVDGVPEAGPLAAASLHTIASRTWNDGDTVVLDFPMSITTTEQTRGSVSVHRGPLVYSLQIGESWTETTPNTVDGIDFGEYEVRATTPWNYALELDPADVASSFQVVTRPMPANPFVQATTPVVLQATGRAVPGWGLRTDVVRAEEVPASPLVVRGPDVPLTLVPFGAETLRITEFPVLAPDSLPTPGLPGTEGEVTLMEFYAPWCAACAAARPDVDRAEARLGSRARVVRVDVDRTPEAALRWNVDALPSFVVLRGDRALARHAGRASADELVKMVLSNP